MAKSTTTVNLSEEALNYLDWVCSQLPTKPSRSSVLDAILLGRINLDDYPMPDRIKDELKGTK